MDPTARRRRTVLIAAIAGGVTARTAASAIAIAGPIGFVGFLTNFTTFIGSKFTPSKGQ